MKRIKSEPVNFLENPDNVAIGDWVKDIHENKVGRIESRVETGPKMLKFWINFLDTTVGTALAMDLRKVKAPTSISKSIDLSLVIIDPDLQQRVKLEESIIEEYAIVLENGVTFPPITVWHNTEDGRNYLIDGFHRVAAAKKAGINELLFTIKQGEFREAILYSVSLNSNHGLRRSNEDKRKAVMTLLNDEEWSTWSNRAIANQCHVSHAFVNKLRSSGNMDSNLENNESNLTGNVSSGNQESNEEVTRTYITKDGVEATMRIGNIGKSNSRENPDPAPEFNDGGFFPEDNYPEDNHPHPEDVIKDLWDDDNEEDSVSEDSLSDNEDHEDNLELQDNGDKPVYPNPSKPSKRRKRTQKKPRLVNPLSVGDKVKVKDNHYFGGKEGEVTQIPNPHYVMLAFEDNQRYLVKLSDLNPPLKAIVSKPQKPQKKEIFIQEGCNYYAGSIGSNCKWYIEADEDEYKLFQEFQQQVETPTMSAALVRAIVINKENNQIYTDDVVVNLSSKMNHLNSEQRLFLAKQLLEADPDIFTKVIEENCLN